VQWKEYTPRRNIRHYFKVQSCHQLSSSLCTVRDPKDPQVGCRSYKGWRLQGPKKETW